MSIKRRDIVKGVAASPFVFSGTNFLSRTLYAQAKASKKKILFVYTPTGTTKNFWGTSRSSGALTDNHFGSIAKNAGLNTLKDIPNPILATICPTSSKSFCNLVVKDKFATNTCPFSFGK